MSESGRANIDFAMRIVGVFLAVLLTVTPRSAPAQTVTYDYDSLGRVQSASYADGTIIQYQYDAAGNRTVYTVTSPTAPGMVQLSTATYVVSEAGPSIAVTVTRTGGSFGAASVNFATSNGGATAGSDYTAQSGTLNWSTGDSSGRAITIPIADDAIFEGDEAFTITVSGATGATLGVPAVASVTLR